jgi:hypothetical protein
LNVLLCSSIAFQPAHFIVLVKNLAAASMSSSVLRRMFLISRCCVWSHPALYAYRLSWVIFLGVFKTGQWWEDRSKHDFAIVKSQGMPFVTQKSSRSGSLFLSDDKYVGSPIDRCFKLLLSIFLDGSCPLGERNALHFSSLLQWTVVLGYCKNDTSCLEEILTVTV